MLEKDLYSEFLNKIENNQPFSFVRYGDGEWGAVLKNTWMHQLLISKWGNSIIDVGTELYNILTSENPKQDNYYLGIQPLGYSQFKDEIDEVVNGLNTCNADILHERNAKGTINDFFDVLKNKEVILIGPWYMKDLNLFNFTHIETPEYHSWLHVEEICKNINDKIDKSKNQILLFSCSLAAKICIDHFYKLYGNQIIQIDTGSLLDPYCGMYSRKYHVDVINRLGLELNDMMKPKIK